MPPNFLKNLSCDIEWEIPRTRASRETYQHTLTMAKNTPVRSINRSAPVAVFDHGGRKQGEIFVVRQDPIARKAPAYLILINILNHLKDGR